MVAQFAGGVNRRCDDSLDVTATKTPLPMTLPIADESPLAPLIDMPRRAAYDSVAVSGSPLSFIVALVASACPCVLASSSLP